MNMAYTKHVPVYNSGLAALRNLFVRRCVRDDEGAVLLYTVVISFFLLAVFSLIFDVARVSETKMRMQDAADSAALQFATIQARGMNTVQNINNDIYNTSEAAITLYGIGTGLAHGAQIAYASGVASWVGAILDGLGTTAIGSASYLRNSVVGLGLKPLRLVHVYGTTPMAYLAANEAARKNGADNVLRVSGNSASVSDNGSPIAGMFNSVLSNLSLDGLYAVTIPTSFDTALMLPLEVKNSSSVPLNTNLADKLEEELKDVEIVDETADEVAPGLQALKDALKDKTDVISLMKHSLHFAPLTFTHKFANFGLSLPGGISVQVMDGWKDDSFVSTSDYSKAKRTFLPPVILVTAKKSDMGLISKGFLGSDDPPPVMAYAVAQCQGGNVVPYRDGKNYGVSADGVLVPFSDVAEHFKVRDDGTGNALWNALDGLGLFLH